MSSYPFIPTDHDPVFTVSPSRLLELAQAFADYRYGGPVTYPWRIPGVKGLTIEGARGPLEDLRTNCCCFVEALLVRAFHEKDKQIFIGRTYHDAFMAVGDHWGPVHAAIELGFADPIPEDEWEETPWLVVQGWSRDMKRGHTFIVVHTEAGGRVLVLESNNAFAVRGVGYRGLGNISYFPRRPAASRYWTWETLRRRYPRMRAAAIRLDS